MTEKNFIQRNYLLQYITQVSKSRKTRENKIYTHVYVQGVCWNAENVVEREISK